MADLGSLPIEEVPIPTRSRDELPPVLRALQFIYCTPELRDKVFAILEKKIKLYKMETPGMSLWEILCMGVIRLTLMANYDRLEYTVNYDELVRAILGAQKFGTVKKMYAVQTLRDNVSLLDEEMLVEVNDLLVSYGHVLKKKRKKPQQNNPVLALRSTVLL
ncbi:MAG: hypothetical protein WCJ01_08050 [Ignavibacteria bacterium]